MPPAPASTSALLAELARAALEARGLLEFRERSLEALAACIPHDAALFHALSPRVPLDTLAVRGITREAIERTVPRWDSLAVTLGRFLDVAARSGGLACDDEALPARGEARRTFEAVLARPLRLRRVAILHLALPVPGSVPRIVAGVVIGRRQAGPFDEGERAALRLAIPVLTLGEALHAATRSAPPGGLRERLACVDQRLTERQREVVERVALGHRNADIAAALGLSPNTLRNHLARIFDRLGATNRADLVRLAVLVPAPETGTNVPRPRARRRRRSGA